MNDKELASNYRNLLIMFARHYRATLNMAKESKLNAKEETEGGKISGLYCTARVLNKRASVLKDLLMEDKEAMLHFFDTTNLHQIAKERIRC